MVSKVELIRVFIPCLVVPVRITNSIPIENHCTNRLMHSCHKFDILVFVILIW